MPDFIRTCRIRLVHISLSRGRVVTLRVGDLCQYMSRLVIILRVYEKENNRVDCDVQELGVANHEHSFRTVYNAKSALKILQSADG